MSQPRRRLLAVLTALLVALVLPACASSGAATLTEDGKTLIRYQGGAGQMNSLELADALGYLENFEIENIGQAGGGPEQLRALATDQVEIASGPFQGATAKVVASGVDLKAVLGTYGSTDDLDMQLLVTEDSGINQAEDLIGKKIAVNTLGANSEAIIDTYLRHEGLSEDQIDQVTLVPLPGANSESALRNGQVDGALLSFAALQHALASDGLRSLVTDTDLIGPYNGGSLVLTAKFIEKNPEATRELVAGMAKAVAYEQDHGVEKTREVYAGWLKENGREEEIEVYDNWAGNGVATHGGVLRDEDFSRWIDWLEAENEIDTSDLVIPDLYTNEFNPYAKEQ